MKLIRVTALLAIAVIGIGLGFAISLDSGTVVVRYGEWQLSTSLWAGGMALVLTLVVLWIGIRLFLALIRSNRLVSRWWYKKKLNSTHNLTIRAVERELHGDTIESIRLLESAGKQSEEPILYYLWSAQLAERIGEHEKAHQLRQEAANIAGSEIPLLVKYQTALRLIAERDLIRAKMELARILEEETKCAPALLQLIQIQIESKRWKDALEHIALLARLDFLNPDKLMDLSSQCWRELFHEATKESITALWSDVPKKIRDEPSIKNTYVDGLMRHNLREEAFEQITHSLKREWSSALVGSMGSLRFDVQRQIKFLENLRRDYSDEPSLMFALSQLYAAHGDSNTASAYILKSHVKTHQ